MPILHRFTAVAAVVGAVAVAGCGLLPKSPFEGELRVRLSADNVTGDAIVAMKGPAVRMALADMPAAWMLVRFDQRAVSAIDDTSKTAMELTADDVEKAFAKAGWGDLMEKQAAKNEPQPQIEKTGDDDTVAGRSCDVWRVRFPEGETGTVCVADLGKLPWSGVVEQAPVAALLGTDHFPLRAVVTDTTGRTLSSFEVVSIDERTLDETRFMIPAGYTTVSLGGLVREVSAALGAFADKITTTQPRSAQPLNAPVPPTTTPTTETDYGAIFDGIAREVGTIVDDLQKGQQATTTTPSAPTASTTTTTTPSTNPASGPLPNVVAARALADLRCQLQESGQGAYGILCLNAPTALTCVDVLGAAHGVSWSTKPTVRLLYVNGDGSSTGFPDVGGGMTGNPCSGVYDPQTRARIGELPATASSSTPRPQTTPTPTPTASTSNDGCRGLTFRVLGHEAGAVYVRVSDPQGAYRGDTACSESRPVLCFHDDKAARPSGLTNRFDPQTGGPQYSGWSGGSVKASSPVQGSTLKSLDVANAVCAKQLGAGWQMASFHQGGGWGFIANGQLDAQQQYWVHIKDQPANPWNTAR